MDTVRSADGTTIAFTRAGQGPPLILWTAPCAAGSSAPCPAPPGSWPRTSPCTPTTGQNHMVKAQAIAPVLTSFFNTRD
jgi:hypothetical protein